MVQTDTIFALFLLSEKWRCKTQYSVGLFYAGIANIIYKHVCLSAWSLVLPSLLQFEAMQLLCSVIPCALSEVGEGELHAVSLWL